MNQDKVIEKIYCSDCGPFDDVCKKCIRDKLYEEFCVPIEEETENLDYYDRKFDLINNVEVNMDFEDEQGFIWRVVEVYCKKCHPLKVLLACNGVLRRIHTEDLLDYRFVGKGY